MLPAALAAALSWLLTPRTAALAATIGAIDHPGPRKLHLKPIPRIGGVAVVTAAIVSWGVLLFVPGFEETFPPDLALAIGLGLAPLFAVSLADDVKSVGAMPRLAVQFLSAGIAIAFGVRMNPDIHLFGLTFYVGLFALPLSALWIVGVTNAFNLADGLDGLSAGLALISALSFCALGLMTGGPRFAAVPLVLVGAIVGFLPFNLYPARVFLGDVGSTSIGFCLACLGLSSGSALSSGMAILVPVLVLAVPITDTLLAIVRRSVRRFGSNGASVFSADRNHIHHRLLEKGLEHPHVVFLLYAVAASAAALSIGSLLVTARNAGLLLITLIGAAFIGIGRLQYDEFAVIRRGALLKIYDAPVLRLNIFPVFFDLGLVLVSLYVAFGLKYDDWRVQADRTFALNLLAVVPATALLSFYVCRLYRGHWRHAGVEDVARSSLAVALATGSGFIVSAFAFGEMARPSFFAIYGLLLLALVNATKCSFRLLSHFQHRGGATGQRVLIYGAGAGGALAIRALVGNDNYSIRPVGFVDDDSRKQGRFLNGFPVLSTSAALDDLISELRPSGIVIASEKIPARAVASVRITCAHHHVWVMRFSAGLSWFDKSSHADVYDRTA